MKNTDSKSLTCLSSISNILVMDLEQVRKGNEQYVTFKIQ